MCGKVVKQALNVADIVTLGGVTAATGGIAGLGQTAADAAIGSLTPQLPDAADLQLPTSVQNDGAARADEASLAANQRERRRAARRFGRASTIVAGTIGAPAGAGRKMATGS